MLIILIKILTILTKLFRRLFGNGEENDRMREQRMLELYEKARFNAKQLLARSQAVEKEISLLEKAPVEAGGENAASRNPLELLPREMWDAVFQHLKDWNDLKSCFETCQLFRDLLERTKNEWLFEGVLPFLRWKFQSSGKTLYLKCRHICKAWKNQVDLVDWAPKLCHPVHLQVSESGRAMTRQMVKEMTSHGKSPFVGHIVEIRVVRSGNNQNPVEDHEHTAAVEDVTYFINGLGKYITSIYFDVTPHTHKTSVLYKLVLCMISKCQRLKMLNIWGIMLEFDMNWGELEPLSGPEMDALTPRDFKLAPNFEELIVSMFIGFWSIENRILQLCAGQLKKLQTVEWARWTPNFEMTALEELHIKQDLNLMMPAYYQNIHEDLMQLRAPKLKKLALPVNTRRCSLQNLLTLINRFQNIEHLNLDWNDENIGFSKDQLLSIPEGLEPPPSLKTLQFPLDFQSTDKMNGDFLMLFPRIHTLGLSNGGFVNKNVEQGFFVQVSNYWMREPQVYKSNVWELLPFLNVVKMSEWFSGFEDDDDFLLVYSRKKYNTISSRSKLAK